MCQNKVWGITMITIEKTFLSEYTVSEKTLFFDIETTGLSRQYHRVYLIGCAHFKEGKFKLVQWLAESKLEEMEVLEAFFLYAASFDTLIHFNGSRFDLPFIEARSLPYALDNPLNQMYSIDLYKIAKRLAPLLSLLNVKQKTVEQFLQIKRLDEYSGGELILVFDRFCKTGNDEEKRLLLLHNEEDVIGMTKLLALQKYEDYFQSNFSFIKAKETTNEISLFYTTDSTIPYSFKSQPSSYLIEGSSNQLVLTLPILELELKHYFNDTKNYYYFPEMDRAIHKSVATFMEGEKKRCNKQNCYIKHKGLFIPQPSAIFTPEFKKEAKSSIFYAPYKPELFQNNEQAHLFLQSVLTLH